MTRFLAVVALLALAGCGTSGTARRAAVAISVSEQDRTWLAAVHRADLADVRLGRLAERKGGTAAVRHAGDMLAAEHAEFDTKVTRVADALGVDLPGTEGARYRAVADRLEKESGGRFDADFVATLAADHESLIAATEEEIRAGSAPTVKDLARTALPDLRRHLSMLRKANPVG
jgi:putative membrane protein